jgi:hypothetical protein
MQLVATREALDVAGLAARRAAHQFGMPMVRELDALVPRRRHTQRDLVVASLMACDREDRPVHRRWA